jgi:hypothetical protein
MTVFSILAIETLCMAKRKNATEVSLEEFGNKRTSFIFVFKFIIILILSNFYHTFSLISFSFFTSTSATLFIPSILVRMLFPVLRVYSL